jgi:hypothetical protein
VKARIVLSALFAMALAACGDVDESVDSVEQPGIGTSPSSPWNIYRRPDFQVALKADAGPDASP